MTSPLLSLLVAFLLLAANAFYVAAEFALVKARAFRIDALAEDKRFGASLTQIILKNLEAYLACCQLGITMASLGLGWVGEPTVAAIVTPLLEPLGMPSETIHLIAFLIGFLVFSSLHIVIGEQVPKTFAIRNPEPVSLWIAYPLHASFIIFYPLNWMLNAASRATLRAFGVKEVSHADILTGAEIEGLVDASAEHGNLEMTTRDRLRGALDLGELTVTDVMIHRKNIKSLDIDLPPREIIAQAMQSPHTRLPLYQNEPDNIVGILHARDLLRAISEHGRDGFDVHEVKREPWFTPMTQSAEDQLAEFLRRREHFAIVVDEYGALMGLVTLEDILEEIVGDIKDEHDIAVQGVRPQPDGSVNVDGAVPVRDLNRMMNWDLPDEEAVTIAGLVIHEAQAIPDPGQKFAFHGYRFQVLRRQRNQITALRVEREMEDEGMEGG
ncbi:HlyC/CorC family transporter [Terricaulis silvestris]|uniref:Magnesium and cobalt efflux protein CorC n=1 Tax=Terricaulis silvestris TaxID=2686094 RepID=A0A6I6MGX3_9CAUL|nr:CNNM domain-containing protein [Terricaulis silvestris]QGZ93980.1 Magnesium and cobalt efflux protein CorC [Terricaulis silvestris]